MKDKFTEVGKSILPLKSLTEEKNEWYCSKEKQFDIIIEMYKDGNDIHTIGSKLHIAESFVEHILKVGKENELKMYAEILNIKSEVS